MDRYVLVLSFSQREYECPDDFKASELLTQIYDRLGHISCQESGRRVSVFPACSLSGIPPVQRWYFAVQAFHGVAQFCCSDWEEVGAGQQKIDREEDSPNALESCLRTINSQEQQGDLPAPTEVFEDAAEGLHLLSDKLPPPGKALVDVLVLCGALQPAALKDLLPLMGALKHMACWHAANVTFVTQHTDGWQKAASYLGAAVVNLCDLAGCIDHRELWRGGLLIREKKCASGLRFEGFSLRSPEGPVTSSDLLRPPRCATDLSLRPEVFHYYRPILDLVQLVNLTDLPSFLPSSTEFRLGLTGKSKKAKLLLDQLASLQGKVGVLFCLSCAVSPVAQPPASQLSSQRWRESLAKRPKSLPVPEVEVKGESGHYFLLVQGAEDGGGGACRARMLHSASQINGAAAMATVEGLMREKSLLSPAVGRNTGLGLGSMPCFSGDDLPRRERRVTRVQMLALKEYLNRQADKVPVNELKALLNLAREQYLKLESVTLPSAASCLLEDPENAASQTPEPRRASLQQSDWPERSVLHNIENLQRRRQKKRFGLLTGPGSSDCLLGPKDVPRALSAPLDAREILKHFTPDALPAGDLQPLPICRGTSHVFQLSPDLSPGKVIQLPFSKASASHYHGIEFCLDSQRALDRDQGFVRLQSRLIRYETQTTCSKEPCGVPFALSPAPSPAMPPEPDGEALLGADVARLKRRSWDTDATGGKCKRQATSESSDSLGSQSSSGTHPSVRSLRQQPIRSDSSPTATPSPLVIRRTSSVSGNPSSVAADNPRPVQQRAPHVHMEDPPSKESRSQKHHRMLKEVVAKTLKHHRVTAEHKCFGACSQRLFEISKFYLKDLKTSRGLHEEMRKAASSNAKQVIEWVLEKSSKK